MTTADRLADCVRVAAEIPAQCIGVGLGGSPTPPSAEEMRQVRVLWKLRESYEAVSDGPLETTEILSRIASELSNCSETLLLWADTIESLIQKMEAIYGPAPGQGAAKAAQVRAAAVYVISRSTRDLSAFDTLISRHLVAMAVDWLIDGLVLLLNRRNLWTLDAPEIDRLGTWFRLRTQVLNALAWVVAKLTGWFAERPPLLPELRVIVDTTLAQETGDLVARSAEITRFMVWATENRRQIVALVDVVAVAASEAEAFFDMTGPQKRDYAEGLVLALIDQEVGTLRRSSAGDALVRAIVGFAIDVVVRTFNKRGVFRHRRGPTSPTSDAA